MRNIVDEPEGVNANGFERPAEPESQGKPPGAVSLSIIEIQDAICEGPISGLVEGEYISAGVLGEIGYRSSIFSRYVPSDASLSFLRSIYYNDTEIIDESSRRNFQAISVAQTKGSPGGEILSVSDGGMGSPDNLEIIKNVGGERLRGPDSKFVNDGLGVGQPDFSETQIKPGQDKQGRDNAKFYQITNKNIKGFKVNIKVNALSKTNIDGPYEGKHKVGRGDIKGTEINYRIDYRPVFRVKSKNQSFRKGESWQSFNPTPERIYGKISSGYIKTTSILLKDLSILNDPDLIGWEIMIYRSTLESFTSSLRNQSFVDSIVEVYEESFAYPNTAIVKHRFRADAFNEIPARSFRVRLLKVRVPNNYNPILRTYGGTRGGSSVTSGGDPLLDNYYGPDGAAHGGTTDIWNGDWKRNSDGTIKYEWTDNPAWVYFDLLTNARYGLGKTLTEKNIDKWTLFEIAKYCDELVLGENEELEPRFSANVYINTQEDAYSVLNSFASIFRGISIYSGGQLKALSDKPQDAIYAFTNSNVVKGDFNYSSSAKKARNTVCLVRYNNKKDYYKPSVVWDEDAVGIQRYGIQIKELTAFGCTSKGQALRMARWMIASERLETQSVSFSAGIEASYLSAGDIVQISDRNRSDYKNYESRRKAGRTRSVKITGASNDYATIELDSSISGFINNPDIPNGSLFSFTLLTPPSYLDPFTANITGSSSTPFIKRSQVQKLAFFSNQVIHSGRSNFDSGNVESLVSIINFSPNGFAFENKLNTSGFNVTGFTGALYNSEGGLITQTGFVENPPDNFIWSIEYSGELKDKTIPDKELYKIISMEEREDLSFNINAIEYRPEKYTLIESGYYSEKADFYPALPTDFKAIVENIPNSHSKIIKTSFIRGDMTYLGAYLIYYKVGADFTAEDFPDFSLKNLTAEQPYFRDTLNRNINSYDFLPTVTGTHYIRIYPVNFKGKTSNINQYIGGTVGVDGLTDVILDYQVNSLRANIEDGASTNTAGTKIIGPGQFFYGTDISVAWQVGLPGNIIAEVSDQITTRITYRVPSSNNIPNGKILHEITGIDASTFYHELDFATRMSFDSPESTTYPSTKTPITPQTADDTDRQTYYNRHPLREYDVVVELVDSNGKSSAGGTVIRDVNGVVTTDSNYVRYPNGYDILNLYNPAPRKITLTDGVCATDSKFCSLQWVNSDGTIHFSIEKDSGNVVLPKAGETNNIAAFAFLVSRESFSNPEVVMNDVVAAGGPLKNNNLFNDSKSELCFSTTNLSSLDAMAKSKASVLTSFMGAQELYLSIASVDSLLLAAISKFPSKKDSVRKLRFSNVVKIKSSAAGIEGALNIKAWVIISIGWPDNSLLYRSGGLSSISTVYQSTNRRYFRKFVFKTPMSDTNYTILPFYRVSTPPIRNRRNDLVGVAENLNNFVSLGGDSANPYVIETDGHNYTRPPKMSFKKSVNYFEAQQLEPERVAYVGGGNNKGMAQASSTDGLWNGVYSFIVLQGDLNFPIND